MTLNMRVRLCLDIIVDPIFREGANTFYPCRERGISGYSQLDFGRRFLRQSAKKVTDNQLFRISSFLGQLSDFLIIFIQSHVVIL